MVLVCCCIHTTYYCNTNYTDAFILISASYINSEEGTQSVSWPWIKYHLLDRIIKYLFYSLTFGDIWIQMIALLTYFKILMNYLHTNVHISEFSKKYIYFNPYFLGDLAFMRIVFFHLPPLIRGLNKYFSKWDCWG